MLTLIGMSQMEVWFYRHFRPLLDGVVASPQLYFGDYSSANGTFCLLLEYMDADIYPMTAVDEADWVGKTERALKMIDTVTAINTIAIPEARKSQLCKGSMKMLGFMGGVIKKGYKKGGPGRKGGKKGPVTQELTTVVTFPPWLEDIGPRLKGQKFKDYCAHISGEHTGWACVAHGE